MTSAKARRGLVRRKRLESRQVVRARRLLGRRRKGKAWLLTWRESRAMDALASVSALIVGFHVEPPPEPGGLEGMVHEEAAQHSGLGAREQFILVNADKKPA